MIVLSENMIVLKKLCPIRKLGKSLPHSLQNSKKVGQRNGKDFGNLSSIALYKTRLAFVVFLWILIFVCVSDGKASVCDEGDLGSIPGSRRSPGEGNGSPIQYSCLENSMDGGAWWATVHGVAKSQTRLSYFTSLHFTLLLCPFFWGGSQIFHVSFIIKV